MTQPQLNLELSSGGQGPTKNTNSDTARPWSIGKMATTDWNGLECVAAYGLYI